LNFSFFSVIIFNIHPYLANLKSHDMRKSKCLLLLPFLLIFACANPDQKQESSVKQSPSSNPAKGSLFIIGGGELTPGLMLSMVSLSGCDTAGVALILPMSSIEPDSSYLYMLDNIGHLCKNKPEMLMLDSRNTNEPGIAERIAGASLIYLSGGDQSRFMQRIEGSVVAEEIRKAYMNGSMIAGTSAGAALMSKYMITGDQKLVPQYEGTYSFLRSENAIYTEGLGLLENVIIDQHFVVRSRYNRLISALYEKPGLLGMGIDESTAAFIKSDSMKLYGESQVLLFEALSSMENKDGRIATDSLLIRIFTPGQKTLFKWR